MSVSYTFNYNAAPTEYKSSDNSDYSLGNLLDDFDAAGADVVEHGEDNTGGFFTNGSGSGLSGQVYAGTSSTITSYSYSIDAGDDNTLYYDFYTHTLYGTIESITIGSGLTETGEVADVLITLDFSDDPITGTLEEGRTNDVHDIVWGLMNSSTSGASDSAGTVSNGGLQGYLEDLGVDLTAQQFSSSDSSTGTLDTTSSTASLFGETVALAA